MTTTPALDYVFLALERRGEELTKSQRAALLSLGARAERALNHGNGYDLTYPDLVAKDIGLALSTTRSILRRLVELDLVVGVAYRGGARELVDGERARRHPGNGRGDLNLLGYRLPEEAFA